ncbi:hypothetical protein [Streptomyces sp. NPDC048252]|uniref:hypothetical protein n=1 Tax=Streptomyces sp. NPDC048252 TaxID=3154612 RepID=UPI0034300AD2
MAVTISLSLLLFVTVAALVRRGTVTTAPALACTAFGFTLASTGLAPAITRLMHVLADLIATV